MRQDDFKRIGVLRFRPFFSKHQLADIEAAGNGFSPLIRSIPTKVAWVRADVERTQVVFRQQAHYLAFCIENSNDIALWWLLTR